MKYDIDITVAEGPLTGTGLGTVATVDTSMQHWESELHGTDLHDTEINALATDIERAIRIYEMPGLNAAEREAKRESLKEQLCLGEDDLRALYGDLRSVMGEG